MEKVNSFYGVAILIVFYLGISFFYLDFNPANWEREARYLFSSAMIIVVIMGIVIKVIKEETK